MGLLDSLMGTNLDPETDRLVKGVLGRYGQFTMEQKAGGKLLDYFTGSGELDEENKKLDIAMKRRALGMQDSDDFDESRNSQTPLYAMTGRHLLQAIPEPGYLSPKIEDAGKSVLEPFFKIARRVPNGSRPGAIARIVASL